MELTGNQRKQFCDAIESAIPSSQKSDLRRVLARSLDGDYDTLTGGEPVYKNAVYTLVESVCCKGYLVELAIAILHESPGNPELQAFINDQAVVLLVAQSKLALDVSCVEQLWVLLQGLQDFAVIAECCRHTWPGLTTDRKDDYNSLISPKCKWSSASRWLLILSWWVKTKPYDSQGRLSILRFVENVCNELALPLDGGLAEWLRDTAPLVDESWEQTPRTLTPQQQERMRQVRGYCVVDVEMPAIDNAPLIYQCKLHIEVGQNNEFKENQWKALTNVPDKDLEQCSLPGLPDGIETVCADDRMKCVRQQVPSWIRQADELLLDKCTSLDQRYTFDEMPCYETLTIEFCLPWELLIECVDVWLLHQRELRSVRTTVLGQRYKVVVRCRDRFLVPSIFNELKKRWKPFKLKFAAGQEMTDEEWEKHIKILGNGEVAHLNLNSVFELNNYFCQYLGLGLTFPFCSSTQTNVRENLVNRFLEVGVPLIIWSRDPELENLDTNLNEFLDQEWFKDFNMLIQHVFEKRGTVDYSLGKELGVWCDDPQRMETLHKVFYKRGALG